MGVTAGSSFLRFRLADPVKEAEAHGIDAKSHKGDDGVPGASDQERRQGSAAQEIGGEGELEQSAQHEVNRHAFYHPKDLDLLMIKIGTAAHGNVFVQGVPDQTLEEKCVADQSPTRSHALLISSAVLQKWPLLLHFGSLFAMMESESVFKKGESL